MAAIVVWHHVGLCIHRGVPKLQSLSRSGRREDGQKWRMQVKNLILSSQFEKPVDLQRELEFQQFIRILEV